MRVTSTTEIAELAKKLSILTGNSVSIYFELWHHAHLEQQNPTEWKVWVSATEKRYSFPSFAALEQWANDYIWQPVEAVVEEVENV